MENFRLNSFLSHNMRKEGVVASVLPAIFLKMIFDCFHIVLTVLYVISTHNYQLILYLTLKETDFIQK